MHLRPGQSDADIFVHRLDHVIQELLKIVGFDLIHCDRLSFGSNDGMTEARNFQNHARILATFNKSRNVSPQLS